MLKTDQKYPRRGGAVENLIYLVQFVVVVFGYFQFLVEPEDIYNQLVFIFIASIIIENLAVLWILRAKIVTSVTNAVIWCALGSVLGCVITAWYFEVFTL
ncbi:hypothetical protein KODAMA_02010 [Serratia phage vB_SmaM-Kodama]|uniref:Uncharacterized protein n=1 Tax=Serratia phage vB_SmaM_Yaphecito TaxID=2777368 RepID=A0A7T3NBW9_9CAUD|nr:hypothetical protein [Serratia phage vB_SmaM_Yaphecito]UCR74799.1 hypothetical protein [Serratia phage BUCT660]UQT03668.1 hypothetical protein KODAMA_02010 [Serratia phage vB_SmaM-Kodama]